MRCKNCDYPLWNLPARKCPECGLDFKPSDFHFVPNSVKYLCPHCEQQYYGTTEHGQLIPRTFTCVKCAQRIDMDEMLLLPAAGVEETRTAADVMPWLQRAHFGWFKGWIRTIGMAMIGPQRLMRAVPLEGGLGEACLFALLTNFIIAAIGVGLPLGAIGGIMLLNQNRKGIELLGGAGASLVAGTAGVIIVATSWALLAHGLLKISGGTARGLGRTMQAMFYSSASNAPLAIPCLGAYCLGYFTWIWWMVCAILMVMEAQKVKGWRASLCVGAGPVLGVTGAAAWIVFVAVIVTQQVSLAGARAGGGYVPTAEARAVSAGILSYAAAHNGQGPNHAIAMVADGSVPASNFVVWQIGHDEKNVALPAAGISLDAFQYLPANRMQMTAQSVIATQPGNVIAHRMGDVVFTYHGIDMSKADPGLWIAVLTPDPNQANAGGVQVLAPTAVLADGTFAPITPNLALGLQSQNVLRAGFGLPPLPDPSTVLNGAPATPTSASTQSATQPAP